MFAAFATTPVQGQPGQRQSRWGPELPPGFQAPGSADVGDRAESPPPPPPPPAPEERQRFWAPSSPGDLADRWTILRLKAHHAAEGEAREAALRRLAELQALMPEYDDAAVCCMEALAGVNERLWELEDRVRAMLDSTALVTEFAVETRKIPLLNDTRAHLKARIDQLCGYDGSFDPKTYSTL